MNRSRTMFSGAAVSLLLLTACGSDTNDTASSTASTPPPGIATQPSVDTSAPSGANGTSPSADAASTDAPGAMSAACKTWIAADETTTRFFMTQQGDADTVNASLDAAIAAASADDADRLSSLKSAVQPMLADPESDTPDATQQLYVDQLGWTTDHCGVPTIDVSAKEYQYDGVPDTLRAGYTVVNFSNVGNESHEMFAFKVNDGVTTPVQQLLEQPQEQAMSDITPVNASFADPGGSDTTSWDLSEPGHYAVVCFVSTGTTADTEGSGPPHFMQGMIHEFTVTP